jgi:hypothetical protein
MDINFHYYAVKAIAARAGFPENEAQLIASYSQFVDDFDDSGAIALENVPVWARHLAYQSGGVWWFKIVTTGFNSWFDMASLILESNQKWIVMPFHFFPRAPLNTLQNRVNWRVAPVSITADSLLRDMLVAAGDDLLHGAAADRPANLLRIGLLLHIFADTYAHQKFSGFRGWENNSYLTNVTNNVTDADVTSSYSPNTYWAMPSVGHTNVGHAPDDSNVRFTMKFCLNSNDRYSLTYTRSNTEVYCDAGREIMRYLRGCLGLPEISAADWAAFTVPLSAGFRTAAKDVPTLNAHWLAQFPGVAFNYNSAPMKQAERGGRELDGEARLLAEAQGIAPLLSATKSDMWFHYNVFADNIRVRANGQAHGDALHDAMKSKAEARGAFLTEMAGAEQSGGAEDMADGQGE